MKYKVKKLSYQPPVILEVIPISPQQPICGSDVRTGGQDVHDYEIGDDFDDWD